MNIHSNQGVALVFSLFLMVILLGLGTVFVGRTVTESNMTQRDVHQTKALYLAEAASEKSLAELNRRVNVVMRGQLNAANPSTVIYNVGNDYASGLSFSIWEDYGLEGDGDQMTVSGTQAYYTSNGQIAGDGLYDMDILITEQKDPEPYGSSAWKFFYNYEVISSGDVEGTSKDIRLNGNFTVTVQRENFAKFALFTNEQESPSGSKVWFTSNTNFSGPIHTNDKFNIYGNPSGTFTGLAEQHSQYTRFYNCCSGNILADADFNGTKDVPTWAGGFNRDVPSITLNSPTNQQEMVDQATNATSITSWGIHLPNNNGALTGGIFIRGDAEIDLSVSGGNAVYDIRRGYDRKIVTVDRTNQITTVNHVGQGESQYAGVPDGMDGVGTIIYVDGDLDSIQGTVQGDTSVTVASSQDIVIQGNLVYENYSPGTGVPGDAGYLAPSAEGYNNMMGLVSWNGDVRIGWYAPDNVNIHATALASSGIVTVDYYNYTYGGERGTATLLGGVISDKYGPFGTFNSSTGQNVSGFGRNFVYDSRMLSGAAPPYFPTLSTFMASSDDITNSIVWTGGM